MVELLATEGVSNIFNATSPLTSAARALRNGVIIAVLSIAVNSSALAAETSQTASLADISALTGADRNGDGIRDDLESFLKTNSAGMRACFAPYRTSSSLFDTR